MPAVTVSPSNSTVIAAADYNRSLIVITNTDTAANCHINFGAAASTNEAYLAPGANMTIAVNDSRCRCAINGISSSGSITVKYSTFSPGG